MLNEAGAEYRYRDYTREPLTLAELKTILGYLGVSPREVLRTNDKAYKEAGLRGDETDAQLLRAMAEHPTLLQRPIGVLGKRAVLGRPPERLLELL